MNAKQSIVFAHAAWAPMYFQRRIFCDFVKAYRKSHSSDGTTFYYIDFTQIALNSDLLKELKGLNGWSELPTGSGVIHGNGELIWINSGRIVSVQSISNYLTPDELVKKTEMIFAQPIP